MITIWIMLVSFHMSTIMINKLYSWWLTFSEFSSAWSRFVVECAIYYRSVVVVVVVAIIVVVKFVRHVSFMRHFY